jgi:hypothetical protein
MILPRIIGTGALLVTCVVFSFGQDSSGFKINFKGASWAEAGQIFKGYDKNYGLEPFKHVYFQRFYLLPGFDIKFSDRTLFKSGAGIKAFNEFPRVLVPGGTRRFYYYLFLDEAELLHKLVNNDKFQSTIGGGYFQYKYNADVNNLGEYLFRSTAYPQTISTEFDFPKARLAGLYSKNSYTVGKSNISLDFLAFTNTEWVAVGDLNLSLLASYNYAKAFEVGAGVMFGSVISADENFTTPSEYFAKTNATRYLDGTDTSKYYTFRGTKLMGRLSIDPKNIFHLPGIFGKNDLKIYSEAALLGVKNYDIALHSPVWYQSILERIPVMVGFNFPTFKLLDVLSIEGEWWGNRYPNSMEGIVYDGLPLPLKAGVSSLAADSTKYKNDNYKWSIYGSRIFKKHYRIAFQFASDHMRTFAWDWNRQDYEESLRGLDNWYGVIKFGILF